jgi:hypothetical protein
LIQKVRPQSLALVQALVLALAQGLALALAQTLAPAPTLALAPALALLVHVEVKDAGIVSSALEPLAHPRSCSCLSPLSAFVFVLHLEAQPPFR